MIDLVYLPQNLQKDTVRDLERKGPLSQQKTPVVLKCRKITAYFFKAFGALEKYFKNQLSGTRTSVVSLSKAVSYAWRLLKKA